MSYQPLRPMTVGEIMSSALRAYTSRFGTLIRLTALFILPVEVVYAIASRPSSSGSGVASVLSLMLLVLTGQLASAACLKAVSDSFLGHPASWRSSFEFVSKRIGTVIAVGVLDVVIVGVGFLVFVVPGLYLDVALLVATPALLIEDLSPIQALRRSRELVRGMWFRCFGVYLLAAVFVGIVALIPTIVFLHASGSAGQVTASHPLADQIAQGIASILTTPFMASVVVLLYYDLRIRKDGFSLDDLARSVHLDPGSLPPPRYSGPVEPPWPDSGR